MGGAHEKLVHLHARVYAPQLYKAIQDQMLCPFCRVQSLHSRSPLRIRLQLEMYGPFVWPRLPLDYLDVVFIGETLEAAIKPSEVREFEKNYKPLEWNEEKRLVFAKYLSKEAHPKKK